MSHVAPMRAGDLIRQMVRVDHRSGGILVLSSARSLPDDLPLVVDLLQRAAGHRPRVTFLAERRGPERTWQHLTYAEAWARTGAIASWLIAQGFGPGAAPIAILSDNSLENALMVFGALRAGAAVAPLSPNWSLSADCARLDHALSVVEPGLVFAQDSNAYGGALDRAEARGARIVTVDGNRGLSFAALASCTIDASVAERRLHIKADTPAKILFTSGTTGLPKAVLNTHGNLAAAVEMAGPAGSPFDDHHVAVWLDWLPWHHTWGGNASLNGIIAIAGSLYIDGGRPVPGRFQETVDNLRELTPSDFATVPAGYSLLLDALERDEDFRGKFFRNMRELGSGGALLPQESLDRLKVIMAEYRGARPSFGAGWGMTETTSAGLVVRSSADCAGLLGLPQPGMLVKLVPADDRYELRVKGPNVVPGYFRNSVATREAFDEEGFFRTGDAAKWLDPGHPESGLVFAGRLSEEFKLASGTWVRATSLRMQLIEALQPYVRDAVIAGPDRPWLGALIWLDPTTCADAGGGAAWKSTLSRRLAAFNGRPEGIPGSSSTRVRRLLPLAEPPSAEAGEITDKRSINAGRVLARRSADVARLYAEPVERDVIVARGDG